MRPCATGSKSTPRILETQRAEGLLSSKVFKKNAPLWARSQLGGFSKTVMTEKDMTTRIGPFILG